jgi:cyclophilin family peptidyl-prolyl cis-trans isomerase
VENFVALARCDRGVDPRSGRPLCYQGSPLHRIVPGCGISGMSKYECFSNLGAVSPGEQISPNVPCMHSFPTLSLSPTHTHAHTPLRVHHAIYIYIHAFDDESRVEGAARHTRVGLLSSANRGTRDSNGSQFFIQLGKVRLSSGVDGSVLSILYSFSHTCYAPDTHHTHANIVPSRRHLGWTANTWSLA